jgi:heme O synthase-like polyprenyltransferase
MDKTAAITPHSDSYALASKVKDYFILIKFTLSFLVVFSCVVCYLLAPNVEFNLASILLLFIAGMLITGSANAINQTVERDTDALMKRTADRPVAAGRMSVNEAWAFALVTGFTGLIIMWQWFNLASALIGLFSLFLYTFKKSKFYFSVSRCFSRRFALFNWLGSSYRVNKSFCPVSGYVVKWRSTYFL